MGANRFTLGEGHEKAPAGSPAPFCFLLIREGVAELYTWEYSA